MNPKNQLTVFACESWYSASFNSFLKVHFSDFRDHETVLYQVIDVMNCAVPSLIYCKIHFYQVPDLRH